VSLEAPEAEDGRMLALYHATRDDLIRLLLDQQDQLADRDRHLARQEHEIAELRQAVAVLTERR